MKTRLVVLAAIILIGIELVVAYLHSRNRDGGTTRVQPFETAIPLGDRPDSAFTDEERLAPPIAAFKAADGKYGFINRFGFVVIKPRFEYATNFDGDQALVYVENTKSVIDRLERVKYKLPPGAGRVQLSRNGMAWFEGDKVWRWGLVNAKGEVVLGPTYDDVEPFSEGLAAVNLGCKREFPGYGRGGKWGFVDEKGTVVIPIENERVGSFSEGLALVENHGERCVDKAGKTVFALTNSSFDTGNFSEGIAPAHTIFLKDDNDWVTRFFNREGKTEFSVTGFAENFREGFAAFTLNYNKSHDEQSSGFINRSGKIAIAPQFAAVQSFNDGLAAAKMMTIGPIVNGGLWGYIDKTGARRIDPQFTEAFPFHEAIAKVHVGGALTNVTDARPYWKGGEWWLIDRTGRKLKRSWIESSPGWQ